MPLRRVSRALVILTLSWAGSAPALAEYWHNAYWLQTQCQQDKNPVCSAYILGVFDGMEALGPPLFCWPASGNSRQAVEVVREWLGDDENLLPRMSAAQAVILALKEAFPSTVMWMPHVDGLPAFVPLAPVQTTRQGEWVAACDGEFLYEVRDIGPFTWALPFEYKFRMTWVRELLRGPR